MRFGEITAVIIVAVMILGGIAVYGQMPLKMASRWDASGNVNGYSSRFAGVFLLPIILFAILLLFIAIPRIDPLRANIEKFRKNYDTFLVIISVFMASIDAFAILWNLGIHISSNIIMPIGIGLLFLYAGILSENAKRNWFVGFRTPWTLSSDSVWNKTHKIGGLLFKIAGIISIAGIFFGEYAVYFILVPALFVAVFTTIYSYFIYQKENERKTEKNKN